MATFSVVSFWTLCSRIFGFLRDWVLARYFGADAAFDAFVIAFKIPNFFRRLFAEGAFSQAFVPLLSQMRDSHNQSQLNDFIARVLGTLLGIVLLWVLLCVAMAPWVIHLVVPGFVHDAYRYHLAIDCLRITFFYLLFVTWLAFSGALLNTYERFSIPALTPIILNVSLVVTAIIIGHGHGHAMQALSAGVLVGGLVQALIQWPALKALSCRVRLCWGWSSPHVQRLLRCMAPALAGVSVAQVGLLVDNAFASYLPRGSISWLYYADRLAFLPLGVIGVAVATVVLPRMSRVAKQENGQRLAHTLAWGCRCLAFLGVPATVGLVVLALPIVLTLFQSGQFSVDDAIQTQRALQCYGLGLLPFMGVKVLASAYYARLSFRWPVRIATAALAINVLGNVLLIGPMAHAGLALATALAAWVNWLVLWWGLYRQGIRCALLGSGRFLFTLLLATAALLSVLEWLTPSADQWLLASAQWRLGHLSEIIAAALLVYCLTWLVLGLPNLRDPGGGSQ